jgi:Cytochrome c
MRTACTYSPGYGKTLPRGRHRDTRLGPSIRRRWAVLSMGLLALPCFAAPLRSPVPITAGEIIYRKGMFPTGEPLRGERPGVPGVEGPAAACANCHGRSGLGETHGPTVTPPIAGRYLYRARRPDPTVEAESPVLAMSDPGARARGQGGRGAYTDETLARAIREGVAPDGRAFDQLMPRFRIEDSDMPSLIAYLKQLSSRPSSGVGDATLEFATIVAPDADPVKRRGMLDVLENFFGKQNVLWRSDVRPQFSRRFTPGVHRWRLHVWELTGAPESWEAQLDERMKREPVFAVISGIGGRTWAPVHRFCERSAVPCLFPNVDLPGDAEPDFYDLYYSKGVLLEAQLIAKRMQPSPESGQAPLGWRRLLQVYRSGDIGESAAAELRGALASRAEETVDRVLDPRTDRNQVQAALSDSRPDDVVVLWLRPDDIRSLPPQPPPTAAVFVSGIMGGLEQAPLSAAWREVARLTYPFELPDRRGVEMDYPIGWMRFKHIALVDERTQTDTYLACVITAEALRMMREDLLRDHLLETLEMHLDTRLVNGYYPRLGLAPGQRFGSKGGYLARFAEPQGMRLVADGAWTVP